MNIHLVFEFCAMKNDKTQASYIFNNFYKLVILLFISHVTAAQDVAVEIEWLKPRDITINNVQMTVPFVSGEDFENQLPVHSFHQKFKSGHYQVQVVDVQTASLESYETTYLNAIKEPLPQSAQIEAKISKSKNESFIRSKCIPYFQTASGFQKIVSYKLRITQAPVASVNQLKSYASNSVLNSGLWYKISVPGDGVYQLNRTFFKNMGVDLDGLDPKTINLYGNADGRLSELNSDPYMDDLKKNAIQFVGNGDTAFTDDEYFLFFGAGPNRWSRTSGTNFNRDMHIYSTVNTYFIHIDASDVPLRIQSLPETSLPATNAVNSYTYYDIHENESVNLVQGGQRWYGEQFDANLTQTFKFSVPNVDVNTQMEVQYAVASNSSSGGNSFRVVYNGAEVDNEALNSTSADYIRNAGAFTFMPVSSSIDLIFTLNRVSPSVKAYLDYIRIVGRRSLVFYGNSMLFRDVNSVGAGNVSAFSIVNMNTSSRVWDVTSKTNPQEIQGTLAGGVFTFRQATDTLREFMVFNGASLSQPTFIKQIENQDLHALGQYEYIIVSPKQFINQAQRLGSLHENSGLTTVVVDIEQVYNEFSSGNQDATAIRRFVKMFYDRAAGNTSLQPKFLCLFGDATYDPKNRVAGNNYMIPTYEFLNSENHIAALVSDDYFGLLDNNESISGLDMMDIGVGRLLISNGTHAQTQVDKVEHYMKNGINSPISSSDQNSCCVDEAANMFGDWRLVYTNITDDEEGGTFITDDAEPAFNQVQAAANEMNCEKIYSDAYTQVSTTGGHRYPDVVAAITDRVERGSLITNYIGHGGEVGAAEERIITIPQANSWTNLNRLGLFVTATCEFTKFDDPSRESIGELISLNPKGGSICLMTTTRSVYISINTQVVASLFSHVIERDANYDPLAYGEIMRRTKNSSGSSDNRRCFNLIGDPALKISLPKWRIVTDSINHKPLSMGADTVKALTKMHVVGHLEDYSGNKLTTFNGVLAPTIFDKPKSVQTLGNDPNSPIITFKTQKNALYKGRATVTNGDFKFEFVVPKDIDFNYGRGKISYYADNKLIDADGWDTTFIVGGINPNPPVDNVGPDLKIYLNDASFVNGSISSANPLLVVEAHDEFGINTVGNGIGHDITAVLDGNTGSPMVLNEYYKSSLDSYQNGKLQYTLRNLSVGAHTLDVKMWDVNNNSSTVRLEFTVTEDQEVQLDHVLNYPNPFTTHTVFMYEHNQSCASLETQINIYTVSGRLVKTINQLVPTNGFRVEGISWDGRDDFGDQLAKGVYVYQLKVTMPDGKKAQKMEKLVLLK